jgi:hypothetical protein
MEKDDFEAKMMFSVIFLYDEYKGTSKSTNGPLSARRTGVSHKKDVFRGDHKFREIRRDKKNS